MSGGAAPYNAAWNDGQLVGFFDWDLAAPVTPEWDLAFTAFAERPRRGLSPGDGTERTNRTEELRAILFRLVPCRVVA